MQAASYDPERGTMLILDHKTISVPILGKKTVGRILLFDTHKKTSKTLVTMPVVGVYNQLAMTAQEDGTFVLVGRRSLGDHWDAYHFKLDDSEHLVWLGFATGAGKLVGEPLNMGDRLLLPLVQKGEVKLHELDPARFFPNVLGCAEL